jgi:hypothetical protein
MLTNGLDLNYLGYSTTDRLYFRVAEPIPQRGTDLPAVYGDKTSQFVTLSKKFRKKIVLKITMSKRLVHFTTKGRP